MSNKTTIFVSVKQQVNDIHSALAGLLSELQSLRKTVDSLYAENHSPNRNVDRLLKENRELRKRLEIYEKPPKDSGNSSTPPSKEPMQSEVERRTKSLRKKSDKAVGGQPGHEGTTRKMVEIPDEIEKHRSSVVDVAETCRMSKGNLIMSCRRLTFRRYNRFTVNADFIKRSAPAVVATVIMLRAKEVATR